MKFIKIIILIIAIAYLGELKSQEILYSHSKDEVVQTNDKQHNGKEDKKEKIKYRFNTGTGFSVNNFGNAIDIYAEPEIAYRLSPKFSISTGFLFVNTTFTGMSEYMNKGKLNYTNTFVTAGIDYNATERLRISGEILYGLNKSPYSFGGSRNTSDYYLRFSAEYKITKSLSFGVQIIQQSGNNPFYSPIYYRPAGF